MNLKDEVGKVVNVIHRSLVHATGGKVGGKVMGMPVVVLHHTGRTSGKARTSMLTAPIVDGDTVVLVASWGGDDRHPQWYRNITANPDVEIELHGQRRPMRARTASEGEKAGLWPRVVSAYKGYAGYQEKTEREIPLVILEPR